MTTCKHPKIFLCLLLTLFAVVRSAAAAGFDVDADADGVALRGHDPVAYFSLGKPVLGSGEFTARAHGALYRFASRANRDLFVREPDRYLPAYGGYCAYGVSLRVKVSGDPVAWKIVDGVLYINSSLDSLAIWSKDIPSYIHKADEIWPEIRDLDPKSL